MGKTFQKNGLFYPSTLEECFESQGDAPYSVPPEMFCNASWDTILCWPPTLIGSTTKLPCPKYLALGPGKFASKSCGVDGKWLGIHPGKEKFQPEIYPGWTNYSECTGLDYDINNVSLTFNVSEKAPVSFGSIPLSHNSADVIGAILLTISLFLLGASLVKTSCSQSLMTMKVRLYRNIFAALIIHDGSELVVRISRSLDSNNDLMDDVKICVSIGVIVTLTASAVYAWLAIVMVSFTFVLKGIIIERRIYYILCLLGWFLPTVFTTTWLSVTVLAGHLNCLYGELYIAKLKSSFWIIEAINIALLFAAWAMLVNFLRNFKENRLHRTYVERKELCVEFTNIKQSASKTLVVLGHITVAYVIYVISSQDKLSEPFTFVLVLTFFSRGITTSIFLCFLERSNNILDCSFVI